MISMLPPHDKTIQQLFEEQVERTPDNVAIVYKEEYLTYWEFNERSNQLAYYLKQGVGPDTLVAIACERCLDPSCNFDCRPWIKKITMFFIQERYL